MSAYLYPERPWEPAPETQLSMFDNWFRLAAFSASRRDPDSNTFFLF